jgi:hypothetical protein
MHLLLAPGEVKQLKPMHFLIAIGRVVQRVREGGVDVNTRFGVCKTRRVTSYLRNFIPSHVMVVTVAVSCTDSV